MKSFHNLVHLVQSEGLREVTRAIDPTTGKQVHTLSVFGAMWRHDMAEGFPLLTTKRVPFRIVAEELLWFLRGETNVKSLHDRGVTIWDEWCDENGELGPVYGHGWRRFGSKPKAIRATKPMLRIGVEPTFLGVANGEGKTNSPLGKTWEGMLQRCYSKNDIGYPLYGGRGVHVVDRWLEFRAFAEDAKTLPGWEQKETTKERYVLDKDGLGDGFTYGPHCCQWVPDTVNSSLRYTRTYTVQKDAVTYKFTSPTAFCREHGIDDRNFSDLWTEPKQGKKRYGFSLVEMVDTSLGIDQIKALLTGMRRDPRGRRHIVSAWDATTLPLVGLPPCHYAFQLKFRDGRWDMLVQMRSADLFLGVPFNIASYGLLLHMLCKCVNGTPGVLKFCFGDLHIYENHTEQVRELLSREPRPLPTLSLSERVDDPMDYAFESITLEGYDPHPTIAAPVAV